MTTHPTEEIEEHVNREPPLLVHHYTDQHGLLGIIRTGEIWATSILNLNDSREFLHGRELAVDLIVNRLKVETDQTRQKVLGNLLRAARASGINICVASWSEVRDDLSQWRAYSRVGTGYTVNIRGAHLRTWANKKKFLFAACVYDSVVQERLMNSLIDKAVAENLADLKQPKRSDPVIGGDFGYWINRYSALFKQHGFAAEREWRLISPPTSVTLMEFRPGRSTLVSYHRFRLCEEGKQPDIDSVHVGPCPDPDLAKASVEFLLAKHCDEIDPTPNVYTSEVPYRNW